MFTITPVKDKNILAVFLATADVRVAINLTENCTNYVKLFK